MSNSDVEPLFYEPDSCPFTATWRIIGGKWKGIIWWRLSLGLCRFSELQRAIPQVSRKMLTQQLREMERDGIVQRTVFDEMPPRVEYSLSDHGRSLEKVIDVICEWGAEHLRHS